MNQLNDSRLENERDQASHSGHDSGSEAPRDVPSPDEVESIEPADAGEIGGEPESGDRPEPESRQGDLPFPPERMHPVSSAPRHVGRASRPGPSIRRLAFAILILASVSVAALWGLYRHVGSSGQSDILALIPDSRVQLTSFFELDRGETLAELVLRHAAWRISEPEIEGATPAGLGFAEIRTGISIPVLVYGDRDGSSILLSIVNYAFLDTHEGLLSIDRKLLEALSEEATFVLPPSSNRLLWRAGDDIFMVSTDLSREGLAARILP